MVFKETADIPYWYLAGIVSFGREGCGNKTPGVYTRVANFLEWIADNIRD